MSLDIVFLNRWREYYSLVADLFSVLLFCCQIQLPGSVGSVDSSILKQLMQWNVVKQYRLGRADRNMLCLMPLSAS